ncbi:PrgI family protein [Candidatus Gracilibacteria bacterium]|nr:PrgI family protein [Candidatus Gracilibacteria bacterium]
MQYKIPVQIENEDPIMLGLSLRQLTIIAVFGGVGYMIYNGLAPILPAEIAAAPGVILVLIGFLIAKFKHSGMTFVQFILAFARYKTNIADRQWSIGIDSFHPFDIGYVSSEEKNEKQDIDFQSKMEKIQELDEKIHHI